MPASTHCRWWLLLLCLTGLPSVRGIDFVDTFSSNLASWSLPSGWLQVEQADQNRVLRGESIPDLFARRNDLELGRSWRLEVDLHFRRPLADGLTRGLAGLSFFPSLGSGVQMQVNIGNRNRQDVEAGAQWFNPGTGQWTSVLGTSWMPANSARYRLHVTRPLDSDRLLIKLTGTNGYQYLAETLPFAAGVLDQMKVMGFRVNVAEVDFDNLRIATPFAAPAPPRLTEQPQSVRVGRGSPVTLRVVVAGPGPFTYQWWRGNVVLPIRTNDTLAIASVTPAQAGVYTVVVGDGERVVTSAPAVLTVVDGFLRVPAEQTPGRFSLELQVPSGVSFRLQQSRDLLTWQDGPLESGTGVPVVREVAVGAEEPWTAYRLEFP